MDLHVVSGFLGSGKTTAIMQACKLLMAQGKRVGVVTNDQGKYLVDTAFFRLGHVPTVEVSGGCFCCNYDDLSERLERLQAIARPDVVFAESVGSCADIVTTVVEPLLSLREKADGVTTLTAFADCRLLRRRLLGQPMPFSDEVVYIFDTQIAESELLVVNKIDLIADDDLAILTRNVASDLSAVQVLYQNSLHAGSVSRWLDVLGEVKAAAPVGVAVDYERYGDGETRLAWLDETLTLEAPEAGLRSAVVALIQAIVDGLSARRAGVGHLKFVLTGAKQKIKVSVVDPEADDWAAQIPPLAGTTLAVLINARVEMAPKSLAELVARAIADAQTSQRFGVSVQQSDAFRPSRPRRPVRA